MKSQGKSTLYGVLLAATLATIFSFIKFNYCRVRDFSGISVTTHACYSDIPLFWKSRLLEVHVWPFSYLPIPELSEIINPIEYPVIVGTIIWLLSYITSLNGIADVNYFNVNIIFLSALFIISSFYIYKINKNYVYYFIFAPAVFFSLFINWDMWAVLPTLVAIYYFDKEKYLVSGIFLAIAVSAKFYPIVLLLTIFAIFIKSKSYIKLVRYFSYVFLTYTAINLPYIIHDFAGWRYFFEFSFNRSIGYGSLWEALNILGVNFSSLNLYYSVATVSVFSLIFYYYYKYSDSDKLYELAFLSVFAFTLFSKVYSPQYILWLTPLAVLALKDKVQIRVFILWQALELIYHLAIWRYIYWLGIGQQVSGVPPKTYAIISLLRMVGLIIFAISLMYPQIKSMNKVSKSMAETRGFEPPKPFRG